MIKPKILVVGPKESGKTNITDLLAGFLEKPSEEYDPTVGVRIREILVNQSVQRRGLGDKILIELWDVSGDPAFVSLSSILFLFIHNIFPYLLIYTFLDIKMGGLQSGKMQMALYSSIMVMNLNKQRTSIFC